MVPKMFLFSSSRGALLGLWVSLLLTVSFCYSEPETVEVVGMVECTDCKQMNIKNSQAFSGLSVTVDCKFRDQESKAWGMGHPNERGKFKVSLPPKIVANQKMKEDCTANLQNAPCPVQNQLKSLKIIFHDKGKIMLGLAGTLKFSLITCDSKFIKPFSLPAPFYKTLLSQAAHTVYIPRPPSFPRLYPPLPQPVPNLEPTTPPLPQPVPYLEPTTPPLPSPFPHLEPTTPPPAPTLENPFPPPITTPAQSPPSSTPTYEKPDPFTPVGEPLPPRAPMSSESPPPPIPTETLKPPTNVPLSPHSPTSYEPSLPPAYCC